MELRIKNFAKISEADIVIDGITVIAGNNNTGKSTVGKILDAVFNVTNNIVVKMNKARADSLADMLEKELEQVQAKGQGYSADRYENSLTIHRFAEELMKEESNLREICRLVITRIENLITEISQISESSLSQAIYTKYFRDIFHEQINSLYHRDDNAEITLQIKGKKIQLTFSLDECVKSVRELAVSSTSLYIDDPFVLDELNNVYSFFTTESSMHKKNIIEKLRDTPEKAVEERVLSELLINKRLEEITQLMDTVASGKVLKRYHYMYQMNGDISKELDVASLSTGLKTFVIIKQLLLNGALNEKDVIVLDEPEIHLHPEWQLIYAEIIVLLQKKFDFHIIVTTHSSHFMEALELFSKKYGISKRCNYYLADVKEDGAYFENVTDNLSKIYKQMVDPTLLLSRLREELETADDEL